MSYLSLEKEDEQEYARVVKAVGGSRFSLSLNGNGNLIIGKLRGTMKKNKKKHFVEIGCIVLVSMREFQDNVADIIHVYSEQEAKKMVKNGDFIDKSNIKSYENNNTEEDETGYNFEEI